MEAVHFAKSSKMFWCISWETVVSPYWKITLRSQSSQNTPWLCSACKRTAPK